LSLRLVAIAGKETVDVGPYRTWTVGRAAVCDLPLDEATVSRRHAELALVEGVDSQLRVRDLGSTNGTFLNGRKISEALAAAGDRVAFGSAEFAVEEGGRGASPRQDRDDPEAESTLIHAEAQLGGEQRRVAVLFSDIRGFTALSEHLNPDQIAALLNDYFTEMVEIVFALGGTVDKFIGDSLMATWGAPHRRPDDADRAMQAAVRMQRALARRNAEASGGRELAIGIGLNAGEVFAGPIGSDRRLDYTVVGDVVNVAALLCAAADPEEILVAESFYTALREPPRVSAPWSLPLKGREQPVAVRRVRWQDR
jgi:class 3 adenylate cyclase